MGYAIPSIRGEQLIYLLIYLLSSNIAADILHVVDGDLATVANLFVSMSSALLGSIRLRFSTYRK